jgi:hypothetical protein
MVLDLKSATLMQKHRVVAASRKVINVQMSAYL